MRYAESLPSTGMPAGTQEYEDSINNGENQAAIIREQLRELSISPEEKEYWERPVQDIRNHIINFHKKAGIEITEDDIPELILIPERNLKKTLEIFEYTDEEIASRMAENNFAIFRSMLNASIVVVHDNPKNQIFDIMNICHEMAHSVGRRVSTVKKEGNTIYRDDVVIGFKTLGKDPRGVALEELVPTVLADDYATYSEDETVQQLRMACLGITEHNKSEEGEKMGQLINWKRYSHASYNYIKAIFFNTCEIAQTQGIDSGEVLSKFIKARVDNKERPNLHYYLVETIGEDNARALARANMDDTELLKDIADNILEHA